MLGLSFAGSAAACVLASASYPVAIWAVAFAVGHKLTHPDLAHICPLAAIAGAQEDGDGNVVAKVTTKRRQN